MKASTQQILDAVEKAEYETRVTILELPVSTIRSLNQRLVWLTGCLPSPNTEAELKQLLSHIKSNILTSLYLIHSTLIGEAGVEGLLRMWHRMILKRTIFIEPEYPSIQSQIDFYLGIQTIALNLIVEVYHSEIQPNIELAGKYLQVFQENTQAQSNTMPIGAVSPGILTDSRTGLMWQRDTGTFNGRMWGDSDVHCQQLTLGGFVDWRLPSYGELKSLLNGWDKTWMAESNKINSVAKWLTKLGIINVKDVVNDYDGCDYWVSNDYGSDRGYQFKGILTIYANTFIERRAVANRNWLTANTWAVRGTSKVNIELVTM